MPRRQRSDADADTSTPWLRPVVLTLVVLVPALIVLLEVWRPRWYPAGDMAQAELHVRGFWHRPPLVGAAGRIVDDAGTQGSHPGPAMWLALYPVYALFGRSSTGLMVSVVAVHGAAIFAALWLAWRRGGTALVSIMAVVVLLVIRASGPLFLIEPWNPWLAVLPLAVFVLACWSVLDGELNRLWIAVAAGTFSVQCHVGYALVVGGLLGLTTVWVVVRGWRAQRRAVGRAVVWATAVGALMWLPPLVDQLRRQPGNFTILAEQFLRPGEPYLGWSAVRHVLALNFNAFGPWLTGAGDDRVSVIGLFFFLGLWAGAIVTGIRRADRSALHAHVLLGVGAVLGMLSVKRIFGPYFEYTTRWLWVVSALVVAVSLWTLWRAYGRVLPRRAVALGGTAMLLALVVTSSIQLGARAEEPGPKESLLLRGLAPQVPGRLDPSRRYLLRFHDPTALGASGFGLLLDMERRGYDVGVDSVFAAGVLPHRVAYEDQVAAVLYLVTGSRIDAVRAQPGVEEVASFDPRTEADTARAAALRAELAPYLADPEVPILGNIDIPLDALAVLTELNEIPRPAALFVVAPGTRIEALTP